MSSLLRSLLYRYDHNDSTLPELSSIKTSLKDFTNISLTCRDDEYLELSDLDFANKFTHVLQLELCKLDVTWSEIIFILKHMPSLEVLNLSGNISLNSADYSPELYHANLKELILNSTNISLTFAADIVEYFPNLETLHLSSNNYDQNSTSDILLSDRPNVVVKNVYLSRNSFTSIMDILPIGQVFKAIELMCLSECHHLSDFPETITRTQLINSFTSSFPRLKTLFISHCPITCWYTINFIGMISSLEHLTITDIPLVANTSQFSEDFSNEEKTQRRRYLLISNLPNVKYLNHTLISAEERENAERFSIRYFDQVHEGNIYECPSVYRRLVEKHGQLQQLAEIEMSPQKEVIITVEYYREYIALVFFSYGFLVLENIFTFLIF